MTRKTVRNSVLLQRDFLTVFIVIVNAFSWYFPFHLLFQNILQGFQSISTLLPVAFGVQLVAIVASAIVGTALAKGFQSRNALLSVWMFVGIIASTLLVLLETYNMACILTVSFLSGISLGLGFPSCLAYFGDYSIEENRGWLAGITFLGSGLGILLIGLILSFSTLVASALILAVWRGIGLVVFLLARSNQHYPSTIGVSYRSVLLDRSFILYLVPWIMFCLINFFEAPIVVNFFGEVGSFIPIAEYGIGSFSALICGWFADSIGRKRIVVFGFIILGIGYAALGLFPSIAPLRYLYIVLDGVAWGIFSLMFYLVVWTELAGNRIKEKYYLVGTLPFIMSSYIQVSLSFTPYPEWIPVSAAFSLASFFLFLAVLPLVYAPETLPERKIELKRLRKYVEKAKKVEEKHKKD